MINLKCIGEKLTKLSILILIIVLLSGIGIVCAHDNTQTSNTDFNKSIFNTTELMNITQNTIVQTNQQNITDKNIRTADIGSIISINDGCNFLISEIELSDDNFDLHSKRLYVLIVINLYPLYLNGIAS